MPPLRVFENALPARARFHTRKALYDRWQVTGSGKNCAQRLGSLGVTMARCGQRHYCSASLSLGPKIVGHPDGRHVTGLGAARSCPWVGPKIRNSLCPKQLKSHCMAESTCGACLAWEPLPGAVRHAPWCVGFGCLWGT